MKPRIILGMGTGQCGLNSLFQLLSRQPSTSATLEQAPLLPWVPRLDRSVIRERIARWKGMNAGVVADVAAFYLPYVEAAIEHEPGIKMVCLKRPKAEVVAAFAQQLATNRPLHINHWAENPAPGWSADPLWSATFPKYETQNRNEGIARYWDEYYEWAELLQSRHPERFRVVSHDALTTSDGVRSLLSFLGFARESQVVTTSPKLATPPANSMAEPTTQYRQPLDPRRCVVLVPFQGFIHQECDQGLKELERRGYQVRRVGGFAAIDQGRNQIATDALVDGFEETLWIDSDVGFQPDDVEKLRGHNLPIVCGIYPQKGRLALASHMIPGTPRVVFGKHGGPVEILYAGAGFLHIRREVYLAVQRKLDLPVCNERFKQPMIPFFYPMLKPTEDGHWYLAEDYAFCERARQCGFRVFADTSIRLWHIGNYRYSWEDAGMERPRFGDFTLNFKDVAQEGSAGEGPFRAALADFAAAHPWPETRPEVDLPPKGFPIHPETRRVLEESVPKSAVLLVEVGAGTGRSARGLADLAPRAAVIAIDDWPERSGASGAGGPWSRSRAFDAFLSESWDYRERLIAVRASACDGLREVAEAGLEPDVICLNGSPVTGNFSELVYEALDRFPRTVIVGTDNARSDARSTIAGIAENRHRKLELFHASWRMVP